MGEARGCPQAAARGREFEWVARCGTSHAASRLRPLRPLRLQWLWSQHPATEGAHAWAFCPGSAWRSGCFLLCTLAYHPLLRRHLLQVSGPADASNFDVPQTAQHVKRSSRYISTGVFKDF